MASKLMDSPNPLRIAVLTHFHHPISSPYAAGLESRTAHLVSHFGSRGHEVTLFAKESSEQLATGAKIRIRPVLAQSFVVNGFPDKDQRKENHQLLDAAIASAVRSSLTCTRQRQATVIRTGLQIVDLLRHLATYRDRPRAIQIDHNDFLGPPGTGLDPI